MVDGGESTEKGAKKFDNAAAAFYQRQAEKSFIAAFWSIDVNIVFSQKLFFSAFLSSSLDVVSPSLLFLPACVGRTGLGGTRI